MRATKRERERDYTPGSSGKLMREGTTRLQLVRTTSSQHVSPLRSVTTAVSSSPATLLVHLLLEYGASLTPQRHGDLFHPPRSQQDQHFQGLSEPVPRSCSALLYGFVSLLPSLNRGNPLTRTLPQASRALPTSSRRRTTSTSATKLVLSRQCWST
jgi:hypothetical protein